MVNKFYKGTNIHLSKVFFSIFVASHILIYFLDSRIGQFLGLNPQRVINDIEIWRIFTYPFVSLSIAEIILFTFAYLFIAPKIEYYIISKPILILSFVSLIPLQGILSTLLFARENIYLFGTEALSFAVITLYFLIFYRIVSQYRDTPFRLLVQTALIVFFWIMAASLDAYVYQRPSLINSFGFALSGVTTGIICFYFAKPIVKKIIETRIEDYTAFQKKYFQQEENKIQNIHQSNIDVKEVQNFLTSNLLPDEDREFEMSEERLNQILDKINERGKDALSSEEIKFLECYSKYLNNFVEK